MENLVYIKGIVAPVQWDTKGNVIGVAVFTYQEEKFEVADTPAGRELLKHLRAPVLVQGVISDTGAVKTLIVHEFQYDQDNI